MVKYEAGGFCSYECVYFFMNSKNHDEIECWCTLENERHRLEAYRIWTNDIMVVRSNECRNKYE